MHPPKLLEQVWQIFIRNALARVFYADVQALSLLIKEDIELDWAGARELYSVLEQVNEYLEQAPLIAHEHKR